MSPWNKGKLMGAKPPLSPKQVWSIRIRLELQKRTRDLALLNLGLDSKLRGCDLVRMRVDDVTAFSRIKERASVLQRKTKRPVQFEMTEQTRNALQNWIHAAGIDGRCFLFPSRPRPGNHICTRQYARLIAKWTAMIGLDPRHYGTHSIRRTKATLIYHRTKNIRAVQILLGHTKLESTVRYLGVEVNDALRISEQVDL
jgi:integrase